MNCWPGRGMDGEEKTPPSSITMSTPSLNGKISNSVLIELSDSSSSSMLLVLSTMTVTSLVPGNDGLQYRVNGTCSPTDIFGMEDSYLL